jgi:hypothetical protein
MNVNEQRVEDQLIEDDLLIEDEQEVQQDGVQQDEVQQDEVQQDEVQQDEDEEDEEEEEKYIHVKYIVSENGLLDVESDDEQVEEEQILGLKEEYGYDLIEKIIRFHKYTNLEIDDHLDYLREISFVYLTAMEREEISTLYKRFKKRYVFDLLRQLFKLLDLVISKDKKKIVSYFLYYVLSRTLQTLSVENAAKLYISSYRKMVQFKENENFNLEEFLMFDDRQLPKIEKVL